MTTNRQKEKQAIEEIVEELGIHQAMWHDPFSSTHEGYAFIKEGCDGIWDEIRDNPITHKETLRIKSRELAAVVIRFMIDLTHDDYPIPKKGTPASSGEDLDEGTAPASSSPAPAGSLLNVEYSKGGGYEIVRFWEGSAVDAYRSMCQHLNKELGYDDDPPFVVAVERIKTALRIGALRPIPASSGEGLASGTAPASSGEASGFGTAPASSGEASGFGTAPASSDDK